MCDIFSNEKCKKFASSCLNRELKSHQKNCVQDRLLKESNSRFDRSHKKESKTQTFIREGIQREHGSIVSRTPSISEWMKQHQRHMDAWKEQERQKLENRHRYMIRQYRIPKVKSLDSSGMNMSINGTDPIGKVQDPEESGDLAEGSEDSIPTSTLRRTSSDTRSRPKTSGARLRRRASVNTESRSARYPRRCSTSMGMAHLLEDIL
ncbi:uncharacterized protein LOC124151492 isoform X1 [Haliotis rufescens]|uniref:uncharacterized protein LOC124151492 isoform X1 n=1 Tax=Haliotis rufescens TaxID=6454 RepID=UPI001EAFFB77|nr:uncharacterized protein LOC124151492 isoform X1 [Haliotis rufescens]